MDSNGLHFVVEIIRQLLPILAILALFYLSLPRDVRLFTVLRSGWPTDATSTSTPRDAEESLTSLEQVSRIAIIVIGTLYSIGLVIVNMNLGRHGLFQADLARPEYIMAGALWAFLAALSMAAIGGTRQNVKRYFASETRKVATLKTIITILAVGSIYFYVLEILSKSKLYVIETSDSSIHWPGVLALFFLLSNAVVPLIIVHIRHLIHISSRNLSHLLSLDLSDWNSLYALALNLSLIAGYATFTYPLLAREYGGGTKPLVEIGLSEGVSAEHLSLHLPISNDRKILGPVRLVLETDKMLFVNREQSPMNLTALFAPEAVVGIDKAWVTILIYKSRRLGGK